MREIDVLRARRFTPANAEHVSVSQERMRADQDTACMEKSGGVTAAMQDCIGEELARQDKRLNAVYKVLLDKVAPKRKTQLRDAQRKWLAFREGFNAYVTPFVETGRRIDIGPKSKAVPVTRVSKDAGENLRFSGDSTRLHWSFGPQLFQRDLEEDGVNLGRQLPHQEYAHPVPEEESDGGGRCRDQEALREEASNDPESGCPERRPNRELAPAVRDSREQEVGSVSAGEEEHEPRDRQERGDWPSISIPQERNAAGGGHGAEWLAQVGFAIHRPLVVGQGLLANSGLGGPKRESRGLEGLSRPEPPQDLEPLVEGALESALGREWNEDVEATADLRTEEAFSRDADDGEGLAIE